MPEKYSELHFFLDESGLFGSTRELMLVGGVLLFGAYNHAVEDGIRQAMVDALGEIGGRYPNDLHFNHYRTTNPSQGKQLAASLSRRLDAWRQESGVDAYGILIRHRHDIFSGSSGILAERELDNRYISMLWSLVEHFVFVNEKVSRRLTDDAAIHLHIANRAFPFPANDDVRNLAESLGWYVVQDRNSPDQLIITSVLNGGELRGMFRVSMRDRWRLSKRNLVSVDIARLQYHPTSDRPESTAALYLADVLLGVERRRMCAHTDRTPMVVHPPLPILDSLDYDHRLESLSFCKSRLDSGDTASLLAAVETTPFDTNDSRSKAMFDTLVDLFVKAPELFYPLYETASRNVDTPQDRRTGLELLVLLQAVHEKSKKLDLTADLYEILVPFSAANHAGDVLQANELWEHYLPLEKELPRLGPEKGLEMETSFRCRRAVNLMDQFRFAEVEQILTDIGMKEERFRKQIAEFFGTEPDRLDRRRLGICYNTLGQACSFQSADPEKRKLAESLFRSAIECFTNDSDIERAWVYLGHLACDFPENGRDLWNEVSVRLCELLDESIDALAKPFVFALLAKGALVFGDEQEKRRWNDELDKTLNEIPEEILAVHPFGLILQTSAMLNDILGRPDKAKARFRQAERSLMSGAELLKILATFCRLRLSLSLDKHGLLDAGTKESLRNDVRFLRKRLPTAIISVIHTESVEHARDILPGVRFNYW